MENKPALRFANPTKHPFVPSLAGLEELDLSENALAYLPGALTAAAALTRLSVARNELLRIDINDVHGVLAHLPHLQFFDVTAVRVSISALMELARLLPRLVVELGEGFDGSDAVKMVTGEEEVAEEGVAEAEEEE